MKKNDIKVGGTYLAKVSNKLVTVRVDEIVFHGGIKARVAGGTNFTRYHVTNLSTNRQITFRSAAKFRSEVK